MYGHCGLVDRSTTNNRARKALINGKAIVFWEQSVRFPEFVLFSTNGGPEERMDNLL